MNSIQIRPVASRREKRTFLTFPWRIYKNDPLWVPPLLPDREKATDPACGLFFKDGYADFFIARRNGEVVGTISCAHETNGDPGECMIGFFECIDDYPVAEALFSHAEDWARAHGLTHLTGTYNLDREENRGILIEGRARPPAFLCGHTPPWYAGFFERYGFTKQHDDGLAYAYTFQPNDPALERIYRLAGRVRQRRDFTVRALNLGDPQGEIDRIWRLQNRASEHLPGFMPLSREAVETMMLPLKDMADPELILFAEAGGEAAGWFPAIPNFNEIIIKLNGLRYPWDYLRALRYKNLKPQAICIKSVAVLPEYWDTGLALLLFAEMAKRAQAKGYKWVDMSLTGEDNPDTWNIAHHIGAKIYKRYRFYTKNVAQF